MRLHLVAGIIFALTAAVANATLVDLQLVDARRFTTGGARKYLISSPTATTWQYNTASQVLTQTGGTFELTLPLSLSPLSTAWTQYFTGFTSASYYGGVSADTFICTEGNEGVQENVNWCGGYSLGANFIDESTATWGPGLAYSRTIGGDDVATYQQWNIYAYSSFHIFSWDGTTMLVGDTGCLSACSNGRQYTLQTTTPIPATAWLLGTGLAGLVGRRLRRSAT